MGFSRSPGEKVLKRGVYVRFELQLGIFIRFSRKVEKTTRRGGQYRGGLKKVCIQRIYIIKKPSRKLS